MWCVVGEKRVLSSQPVMGERNLFWEPERIDASVVLIQYLGRVDFVIVHYIRGIRMVQKPRDVTSASWTLLLTGGWPIHLVEWIESQYTIQTANFHKLPPICLLTRVPSDIPVTGLQDVRAIANHECFCVNDPLHLTLLGLRPSKTPSGFPSDWHILLQELLQKSCSETLANDPSWANTHLRTLILARRRQQPLALFWNPTCSPAPHTQLAPGREPLRRGLWEEGPVF